MSAIAYLFECVECRWRFQAPEVPEISYGLFVMRGEDSNDAAFLDALEDSVFAETYEIVKQHVQPMDMNIEDIGAIQQKVFEITCDPTPVGGQFRIGLLPRCPLCASRRVIGWHAIIPVKVWPLPNITHITWNHNTYNQKVYLIAQKLRQLLEIRR